MDSKSYIDVTVGYFGSNSIPRLKKIIIKDQLLFGILIILTNLKLHTRQYIPNGDASTVNPKTHVVFESHRDQILTDNSIDRLRPITCSVSMQVLIETNTIKCQKLKW